MSSFYLAGFCMIDFFFLLMFSLVFLLRIGFVSWLYFGIELLELLCEIRENALYKKSSYHTSKSMKVVPTLIPHLDTIYENDNIIW